MSSSELRWYLRWAPVKLVVAILFVWGSNFGELSVETVLSGIIGGLVAYGFISTFIFVSRLLQNWLLGIVGTGIVIALALMMDHNTIPGKIVLYAVCLFGPLLDIILLVLLIRASIREKKLYNAEMDAAQSVSSASATDEIMKYKQLLDAGAITQEEYDAKKRQLLGV
jgi:uncharacterized membrane protein